MDKPDARMRISVVEAGPYAVRGGVPLVRLEIATNQEGESVGWREVERIDAGDRYRLCRCGHSAEKPFCDGTHAVEGFDGTETAGHESYAEQSVPIEGPGVRLSDARRLCAEARFCDRAGGLWNLIERCDDPDARDLAEEQATLCPSGRYVLADEATGPFEPELEPSIALVEDPYLGVSGPLWVRGGIPIKDSDGVAYEVRNRVTLCRCGASGNKPFCDGSHIKTGFRDER
ncbi:MAG: CDGSH iron-sulfur domain-containing protein [Anaerosomatales bacterium]|nr:CDGSH iron-sulfur domain-containing protein [Anaerosomatales bacterium]MDT8434194.1 CDGSH iron-sulfur domain-containing protein [Anaerosomatales bacterium]